MKKHLCLLSFLAFAGLLFSQPGGIEYGSNKEVGKYIEVDGINLYYETYGAGTPLLLLHGGLGSISAFGSSIPVLSEKYKVIAADSPGHGRSEQPEELTYPSMAHTFSKLIDRLGLDSVYVMGWSDGGVIALILAAERPDKVKKIIAVGANTTLDGLTEEAVHFTKVEMADFVKSNPTKADAERYYGWWTEPFFRLSPEPEKWKSIFEKVQKMWATETYIPREQLEKIAMPTMIVQGDRDEIKLTHTEEIFRAIKNAQLCVLPNTSHLVFEERPGLMCRIAMEFFE
ncbi:MAG: alpha/beta hydrolase [Saprospiraceae bacterium]